MCTCACIHSYACLQTVSTHSYACTDPIPRSIFILVRKMHESGTQRHDNAISKGRLCLVHCSGLTKRKKCSYRSRQKFGIGPYLRVLNVCTRLNLYLCHDLRYGRHPSFRNLVLVTRLDRCLRDELCKWFVVERSIVTEHWFLCIYNFSCVDLKMDVFRNTFHWFTSRESVPRPACSDSLNRFEWFVDFCDSLSHPSNSDSLDHSSDHFLFSCKKGSLSSFFMR